jgi:hypothetical protein
MNLLWAVIGFVGCAVFESYLPQMYWGMKDKLRALWEMLKSPWNKE